MKEEKNKVYALLSFLIPSFVRFIPEIIMIKWIVGFDTLSYYIPVVLRWISSGVEIQEFIATSPLLYSLLVQSTLIGIPLEVMLKLLPPILHGILGFVIYNYAKVSFNWSPKKSLYVTLLATTYFVALRISWDMLRNELGLIFLFISLIFYHKINKKN